MKVAVMFAATPLRLEKDEINGGTAHFGAYAEPVIAFLLRRHTRYVVVHRGTGRCVAVVGSTTAAARLMERLESLPVDWGFRKDGAKREAALRTLAALPKAERRGLKPVYDAANKLK